MQSIMLRFIFYSLLLIPCSWAFLPISSSSIRQRAAVNKRCRCQSKSSIILGERRPTKGKFTTSLYSSTDEDSASNDGDEDVRSLKGRLNREFIQIGGPALIQLAAEPLASLVDTAYLGRMGPEVLGGAGVAVSAQYAVSKLYNDPLLRTSISFVASQDGKSRTGTADKADNNDDSSSPSDVTTSEDQLSVAVSSALLLAATVGLVQLVVYAVFCQAITGSMGLTKTSPMWASAVGYLRIRAFGTPAATLWLVSNGIFRGLGDTKTPLIYSLLFTTLNIIFDPIFIFVFHWGAGGAAAGTALAQYIALFPLLRALNRRVPIDIFGQLSKLKASLQQYVKAGGLVLFRTLGKVSAYALCARQAAMLGSVAAAAYNLTFQLGFATTQICEAVAVAVQTLLARELADTQSHSPRIRAQLARHLIRTSVFIGGAVAMTLSLVTFLRRDAILAGLTTNTAVQSVAATIFPAVLATQVLKGLAYPVNGIIMGGLDWFFSMAKMWLSNFVCVGLIHSFGVRGNGTVALGQIWWSLAAFMGTQVVVGLLRVVSRTGPFKVLGSHKQKLATEM